MSLARIRRYLLAVCLLLILTACVSALSADTRVTLRADENWEAQVEIVFAPEQAQLAAGQVEQALDQAVSDMQGQGIEASWRRDDQRRDGNVAYRVSAKGQGLDKLNAAFFDNRAALYVDESSGQRQIVFSYYSGGLSLSVQRQTFTLVGGTIISSNGTLADSHTVVWTNPNGTMEAVLTEAPRYPWLSYALIGAGGVLLVGAILGFRRLTRSRNTLALAPASAPSSAPSQVTATTASCTICGAALPAEAAFCISCGAKR
jgi:hypothetical protein